MSKKKVVTPPFRLAFPSLFEKKSFQGGTPKYSITMIIHPAKFTDADKVQYKAMTELLNEAALDFHKKGLKDFPPTWTKALRKSEDKNDVAGFEKGTFFATATSLYQPGIVDRDKQEILTADEIYPGCWCRASVTAYGYNFENVKMGVSFGLQNIQKLGDGENLSGRTDASKEFEDDAEDVWKNTAAEDEVLF